MVVLCQHKKKKKCFKCNYCKKCCICPKGCKCKVRKCPVCLKCSKCQCQCNSSSLLPPSSQAKLSSTSLPSRPPSSQHKPPPTSQKAPFASRTTSPAAGASLSLLPSSLSRPPLLPPLPPSSPQQKEQEIPHETTAAVASLTLQPSSLSKSLPLNSNRLPTSPSLFCKVISSTSTTTKTASTPLLPHHHPKNEKQSSPRRSKRKQNVNEKNEKDDSVDSLSEQELKELSNLSTPDVALHITQQNLPPEPSLFARVASRVAKDHRHNDFYNHSAVVDCDNSNNGIEKGKRSDSSNIMQPRKLFPSYTSTSMQPSSGQHLRTTGDLVVFFKSKDGANDTKVLKSHQRQCGSEQNRMQADFPTKHPKQYKFVKSFVSSCIKQICKTMLPTASDILYNDLTCTTTSTTMHSSSIANNNAIQIAEKFSILRKSSKKGSKERKAIEAMMQYAIPPKYRRSLRRHTEATNKRINNLQLIQEGKTIEEQHISRKRRSDNVIHNVVDFIMDPDNVKLMSWGYRIVNIGHKDQKERYIIPKIVRRMEINQMWLEYDLINRDEAKKDRVQHTLFVKIAKTITSSGEREIRCIDYVFTNLVSDPISRIQDVIEYIKPEIKTKYKVLTSQLNHVRHFLKYEYGKHIKRDDGDGFHSMSHALTKKKHVCKVISNSFSDTLCCYSGCAVCVATKKNEILTVICSGCKFPFWYCSQLEDIIEAIIKKKIIAVDEENEEASTNESHICHLNIAKLKEAQTLVKNSKRKFFLYMQHRIRVQAQRDECEKIDERMENECAKTKKLSQTMMAVIDFKMKFEPMSVRESQIEGFGKSKIKSKRS